MIRMEPSTYSAREQQSYIKTLIEEERIKILFQPIGSTNQKGVSGVEALARGIDMEGQLIPPLVLFKMASEAGLVIELDRLCQRKAIQAFAKRPAIYEDLILFLNVDNSVIHLDRNTHAINSFVVAAGLSPHKLVLEINELHTADMDAVQDFVSTYRELGFMISIDDIGSGYSNLDRIILLEPDIIKIDRELIRNVHRDYYKQQVVEMVIRLSEKTGAIVVAEGVEKIEEILKVLEFGAQLLQGFYIAKPLDMEDGTFDQAIDTIETIASAQKRYLSIQLTRKIELNKRLRSFFTKFNQEMATIGSGCLFSAMKGLLNDYPQVECAYMIDEEGHQMTDTAFNVSLTQNHVKSLYTPFRQGDDATLKAYYYVLRTTNQPMYISDEYLSLASGHRCITISGWTMFNDNRGILCLDLISDDI